MSDQTIINSLCFSALLRLLTGERWNEIIAEMIAGEAIGKNDEAEFIDILTNMVTHAEERAAFFDPARLEAPYQELIPQFSAHWTRLLHAMESALDQLGFPEKATELLQQEYDFPPGMLAKMFASGLP